MLSNAYTCESHEAVIGFFSIWAIPVVLVTYSIVLNFGASYLLRSLEIQFQYPIACTENIFHLYQFESNYWLK